MTPDLIQSIIMGILSGGLVGGIMTLVTKKARSPESQNELARLGNEFATQMLEEARTERKELRLTISELEGHVSTKQGTIDRLTKLLQDKDDKIADLESRQHLLAQKLQRGEKITLADIFGKDAPEVHLIIEDSVA